MDLTQHLIELAQRQGGLLHRHQLYRGGITRAALRWHLGRDWQAVLPHVVALFREPLNARQRVIAAWLYAGDDSVITGVEAARLHGLKYLPEPAKVRLFVGEHRCRRQAAFAVVRPSTRVDPGARSIEGLRVASPARTVIDCAVDIQVQRSLEAVVLQVVQRRLTTPTKMRHELERGPTAGSRQLRAAVIFAEEGSWSAPEADYLRLLRRSRLLPEIEPNPTLEDGFGQRLPTPDLWIDEVCLALQVHSHEHHTEDEAFDNTLADDGRLTTAGATVLGATPKQIRTSQDWLLERAETMYGGLVGKPRPDIHIVRRAGA